MTLFLMLLQATMEYIHQQELRNHVRYGIMLLLVTLFKFIMSCTNTYDDYLASGGSINLNYTTYDSQVKQVLGTTFSVNLDKKPHMSNA